MRFICRKIAQREIKEGSGKLFVFLEMKSREESHNTL